MKKTLIFYKPEYIDVAIKLRDNYRAHGHEAADIVSVEEHALGCQVPKHCHNWHRVPKDPFPPQMHSEGGTGHQPGS